MRWAEQIINAVLFAFFKKPKEALPVLSKLFSLVFGNPNESPLVLSKCALYYNLLKEDVGDFERKFTAFFERAVELPAEEEGAQTPETLNTLSLIYNKPAETFTKPYKYFITQRRA